MSDLSFLAPFTADQLATLRADAWNRAETHYRHAEENAVHRTLNSETMTEPEYRTLHAEYAALMAAGHEQHELARHITDELTRRTTADA